MIKPRDLTEDISMAKEIARNSYEDHLIFEAEARCLWGFFKFKCPEDWIKSQMYTYDKAHNASDYNYRDHINHLQRYNRRKRKAAKAAQETKA